MAQPLHNPFYALLVAACALLLVTMLIYLVGWIYVPNPDQPARPEDRPHWVRWVDRNALYLIAGEVTTVFVLAGLTVGLDRFFEPKRDLESENQS
jgi:hypothetical protein